MDEFNEEEATDRGVNLTIHDLAIYRVCRHFSLKMTNEI